MMQSLIMVTKRFTMQMSSNSKYLAYNSYIFLFLFSLLRGLNFKLCRLMVKCLINVNKDLWFYTGPASLHNE